jgi:hypothetical protein
MQKFKRVIIDLGYVVLADDNRMIEHATDLFCADVEWECQHGNIKKIIKIVDAPDAKYEDVEEYLFGDNLDDDLSNL